MADNTQINSGSGGDTIATDDIGGVKYPRSKIVLGADGSNDGDVSATNPMPVHGRAAHDAAAAGNPNLIGGYASAAAPSAVSADGDVVRTWHLLNGSPVINVAVGGTLVTSSAGLPVAQQGTWTVGLSAGTNTNEMVGDVAHDAAIAGNPVTIGGVASAAAPSDVSADQDAVRTWHLRNGSQVVNLAVGGTLVTSSAGLPVSQTTASNLNATVVGTGTFVAQINGSALTALQLIDDPVVVDDAAFTPATTSVMMAGFTFDDVATDSVNEGDAGAARMSANRNIYMQIRDAAGNERGVNVNSSNQMAIAGPVTVASGGIASGAIASGAVASGAVASGAFASGALASGSISSGAIADMLVDDAAFTPATSRVMPMGAQADETSTDSVDEGDVGCPRMTLDRQLRVVLGAATAGGASIFRSIDIDETEEDVKTSAGMVYGVHCMNLTNALLYLKFYNATAANVTVGSTTPVMTLPVPANNDTDGAGFYFTVPCGIVFDTAISVAATTGVADADTGAPAANACVVQVFYK